LGGRGRQISEFKVSLVYKVSSRTARAIQRNPILKKTNKQNRKKFFLYLETIASKKYWFIAYREAIKFQWKQTEEIER
jgi:stress response protein YsnF